MSSLEMIGRVWLSAMPKGVSKMVLLCFCGYLNDGAMLSWPSVARVARLCGMGERTVQKHIRALERAGILVARLRRTGRATRYAIALDALRPLPCAAPAWEIVLCAPAVAAAGRERLAALRQAAMDAGLGSAKGCGWAHAAIEKHRAGQPVRRAVLLDACAALRLNPSSLHAARMH